VFSLIIISIIIAYFYSFHHIIFFKNNEYLMRVIPHQKNQHLLLHPRLFPSNFIIKTVRNSIRNRLFHFLLSLSNCLFPPRRDKPVVIRQLADRCRFILHRITSVMEWSMTAQLLLRRINNPSDKENTACQVFTY